MFEKVNEKYLKKMLPLTRKIKKLRLDRHNCSDEKKKDRLDLEILELSDELDKINCARHAELAKIDNGAPKESSRRREIVSRPCTKARAPRSPQRPAANSNSQNGGGNSDDGDSDSSDPEPFSHGGRHARHSLSLNPSPKSNPVSLRHVSRPRRLLPDRRRAA